jgi:uncharacterized damage-inducible protein DinB
MSIVDENGRPEPPYASNEVEMLLGFLDWQRSTLEWKTRGLDENGLRATIGVSFMTLGGILKHMAWVEDHWFSHVLHARDRAELWAQIDFSATPDWEWSSSLNDSANELRSLWETSCETSRRAVNEFLAAGGIDRPARRLWDRGEQPMLRWIILHMIEEYARHNGHADLLREAVDGQVGE